MAALRQKRSFDGTRLIAEMSHHTATENRADKIRES